MKNTIKTISVILSLVFIVSSFCACSSKSEDNTTEADTTQATTSAVINEPSSSDVSDNTTTTSVQTTAAQVADTTKAPVATTAKAVNKVQMSNGQIVALYNRAANRVKSEAKSITRNYQHLSSDEKYFEMPSSIQAIAKSAMGTFVKGSDKAVTWTTKEDFKIGFPVSNEDYTSHLTESMVKSTSCIDNGSTYTISIDLYDDAVTSPAKGTGYAGVFNTVTADSITSAGVPGVSFQNVNVNGIDGHIKFTIDKTTERISDIIFTNTDILAMRVKIVVSTLDAKFALASELSFNITY